MGLLGTSWTLLAQSAQMVSVTPQQDQEFQSRVILGRDYPKKLTQDFGIIRVKLNTVGSTCTDGISQSPAESRILIQGFLGQKSKHHHFNWEILFFEFHKAVIFTWKRLANWETGCAKAAWIKNVFNHHKTDEKCKMINFAISRKMHKIRVRFRSN